MKSKIAVIMLAVLSVSDYGMQQLLAILPETPDPYFFFGQ